MFALDVWSHLVDFCCSKISQPLAIIFIFLEMICGCENLDVRYACFEFFLPSRRFFKSVSDASQEDNEKVIEIAMTRRKLHAITSGRTEIVNVYDNYIAV